MPHILSSTFKAHETQRRVGARTSLIFFLSDNCYVKLKPFICKKILHVGYLYAGSQTCIIYQYLLLYLLSEMLIPYVPFP